jgi:hypothetical protein
MAPTAAPVIGVAAPAADAEVITEFFELFKTPWEFARPGRRYRVLLTTAAAGVPAHGDGDLLLAFGAQEHPGDPDSSTTRLGAGTPVEARGFGMVFPIYGAVRTWMGTSSPTLTCGAGALDHHGDVGGRPCWRVGYDLWAEVRHLLSAGQPPAWAGTPTLDIHVRVLRHVLGASGVPVIEVPPRPHGHPFACCLTHDLDFFGIRRHGVDATTAGFVARATIGTVADLLRGRRTAREAMRNLAAAASLPFVLAGVLPDIWHPVRDYLRADRGHPSTFFVVPFKERPGPSPSGDIVAARAVSYQASDVADDLRAAQSKGHELAVHGIDAWRDSDAGRAELAEITAVRGTAGAGVRMHWLYFDAQSPRRLEDAGFAYDSTYGFNDAVGYRAGTGQVFRAPGTTNLLELPLSIMDTALFFPGRLGLSPDAARVRWQGVLAHAAESGGTVVINWHDRSLAPERLWAAAYETLLDDVERHDPWFASASDVVAWFRWRRAIAFTDEGNGDIVVTAPPRPAHVPAAVLAVQRPGAGEPATRLIDGGAAVRLDA